LLYNQGLLKQKEDGTWIAVESFQEQQTILQQRQQETQNVEQLQHLMNINAPPQIDPERQRASQQLEPNDQMQA